MLIKLTTKKSVKEAATALQSAVEANHFGVMQVHNLKEGVTSFGITGYCPSASGGKM
jgi:uncharacterized protein (DUF302 family)